MQEGKMVEMHVGLQREAASQNRSDESRVEIRENISPNHL
jgi:hypothetical protein